MIMENLKKLGLIIAAVLCAALIISPADILPGIAVDDIVYVIGVIASLGKMKSISAEAA